ncbi:hypothetical protein [Streptomyces sp. NPDC002851]
MGWSKPADRVEAAVKSVLDRGGSKEEALAAGKAEASLYTTAELKSGTASLRHDLEWGSRRKR